MLTSGIMLRVQLMKCNDGGVWLANIFDARMVRPASSMSPLISWAMLAARDMRQRLIIMHRGRNICGGRGVSARHRNSRRI